MAIGEHPAVAALLTVFDAAVDGLSGEQALALLSGPVGRSTRCPCANYAAPCAVPMEAPANLETSSWTQSRGDRSTFPTSWPARCAACAQW